MKKIKNSLKSDFNMITILIIPIAIAINFVCGSLVLALKLPLYLDSIGTFLVAILGGPWVGLVTGLLSIAINSVSDPTLLPYALCAGAAGLMVGICTKRGMMNSFGKFLLSVLFVAIVSMFMSVMIAFFVYGGFDTSGNSIMTAAMISAGIPFWPAQFIGGMISEVPDKFLSILIPYLVVRNMSDRYLYKFSNGSVFIEGRKKAQKANSKAN